MTLASSIDRYLKSRDVLGVSETREDLDAFNVECGGIIPDWYLDILQNFPLCGVELEWPDPSVPDNLVCAEWMDIRNMRSEMLECYPGIAIREHGYICVAGCTFGSGDQYYICNSDGENPPLYQIYHDVSEVADEIINQGREMIFPKLSDLFDVPPQ